MPDLRLVVVDTKEAIHHSLWFEDTAPVMGSFLAEGFKVIQHALPDSDLRVDLAPGAPSSTLRIELKHWSDLIASLRDKAENRLDTRLRHQLGLLLAARAMGGQVSLMVVGAIKPAGGKRRKGVYFTEEGKSKYFSSVSWNEAWSVIQAIQHLGVMVSFAQSEQHVPSAVRVLADLVARPQHFPPNGLPQLSTLYPALDPLATTLTAVPTIGVGTATALAMHFRAFPFLYEATVADMLEVDGVGKILAERVYTHFHNAQSAPGQPLVDVFTEGVS